MTDPIPVPVVLLTALRERVRHDHAYPMEMLDNHHCAGCELEAELDLLLEPASGPCAICGDFADHDGTPHSEATGDGRLRGPRATVDTDLHATYVYLTAYPVARTVEVGPGLNVDLDARGAAVGVEILGWHATVPVADRPHVYQPSPLSWKGEGCCAGDEDHAVCGRQRRHWRHVKAQQDG